MKKFVKLGIVSLSMAALLAGCGQSAGDETEAVDYLVEESIQTENPQEGTREDVNSLNSSVLADAVNIILSDNEITIDGEGTESNEHTKEEAEKILKQW